MLTCKARYLKSSSTRKTSLSKIPSSSRTESTLILRPKSKKLPSRKRERSTYHIPQICQLNTQPQPNQQRTQTQHLQDPMHDATTSHTHKHRSEREQQHHDNAHHDPVGFLIIGYGLETRGAAERYAAVTVSVSASKVIVSIIVIIIIVVVVRARPEAAMSIPVAS